MLSLSEHRVVHQYMYYYLKLQMSIRFEKSLFFNKKKSFRSLLYGIFVCPNHITAYLFLRLVYHGKELTQSTDKKLEDYVSVLRVPFHPLVKSWCDWCSIATGYCNFLVHATQDYFEENPQQATLSKSLKKMKTLMSNTNFLILFADKQSTAFRKPKLSGKELFPQNYEKATPAWKEFFDTISFFYNTLQRIEEQWCPFQHMKNIACLAKTDETHRQNYLKCTGFADLLKAGELFYAFQHIKCHQCADFINEHAQSTDENESTAQRLTDDFFKIICSLTRDTPVKRN